MDFKGLTWAGNIYEKFEAMCLEVEEVMYQDTVKYVENQVQKVGGSFKKFYSEVMQDLLPPPCVDPVKVASDDLSLDPYAHNGVNKNLKPSLLENCGEVKKRSSSNKVIDMETEKHSPLSGINDVNYLSPLSPPVSVQNACQESHTERSKRVGVYRRPIGIKRISKDNGLPKISSQTTPISGDKISVSLEKRGSCEAAADQRNAPSSITSAERCDEGEAVNKDISKSIASIESRAAASETDLLSESLGLKADDTRDVSTSDMPSESIDISKISDTGLHVGSTTSSFRNNSESWIEGFTMADEGISDKSDIEVVENEDGMEIINQMDNPKLAETCLVPDGEKLQCVPNGRGNHKSYKKKIREAISSKLRSTRKHDQDLRIIQHGDMGKKKEGVLTGAPLTMDSVPKKLPAQDFSESDWELL